MPQGGGIALVPNAADLANSGVRPQIKTSASGSMGMMTVWGLIAVVLIATALWPDLPISKAVASKLIAIIYRIQAQATLGRALIAVSIALLIYAAIWTLQGDAPAALAMAMPELAAWFSTFEIATLVDVLVGIGSTWLALRASGAGSILRGKAAARRRRNLRSKADVKHGANDDDGPARWARAA